jgi:hypothetical protein
MSSRSFSMSFDNISDREKEHAASDLVRALKESDPTAIIERRQSNVHAQDLGATIVLILGTGAGIEIARGIKELDGSMERCG